MANLSGSGAPTKTTVGTVGDIYTDTLTSIQYELSSIVTITDREGSRLEYVWDRIYEFGEGGGGQGPQGPPGADGEDGGYYTPSVSSDGDLTWTASDSSMPEVAGVNIKGPKGDTGDPFGNMITLSGAVDFNEYTTPGMYSRTGQSSSVVDTNSPYSKPTNFILEVIQRNATYGYGYQITYENVLNDPKIYFRNFYNGTFSEWKEVATIDDLSDYLPVDGNAATATTLKIQEIPENSDLNNYSTSGFYGVASNVVAATITNSPITRAFSLEVRRSFYYEGVGGYIQTLRQYDENACYIRYNDGNDWSNWVKFTTTDDLSDYLPIDGNAETATTLKQSIISNGVDFNEIKTSGLYTRLNSGGTYQNAPSSNAGLLFVQNVGDVNGAAADAIVFQTYFAYQQADADNNSPIIYNRSYYATDNEWSPWSIVACTSDLANYLPLMGGTIEGSFVAKTPADVMQSINRYIPDAGISSSSYTGAIWRFFNSSSDYDTSSPSAAIGCGYSPEGPNYIYLSVYDSGQSDYYSRNGGLSIDKDSIQWKGVNLLTENGTAAKAKDVDFTNVYSATETVDLNNLTVGGWYRVSANMGSNLLNAPETNTLWIMQYAGPNTSYGQQIFHSLTNNTIYIRSNLNGSWSDWVSMVNGTTS